MVKQNKKYWTTLRSSPANDSIITLSAFSCLNLIALLKILTRNSFHNHLKYLGRTRLGVIIRPVWLWHHFHLVSCWRRGSNPWSIVSRLCYRLDHSFCFFMLMLYEMPFILHSVKSDKCLTNATDKGLCKTPFQCKWGFWDCDGKCIEENVSCQGESSLTWTNVVTFLKHPKV